LLAGLTDVIDGRLARALGQVSRLGALLDLVADRLLTLTVLVGLIGAGDLKGPFLFAGALLVARDLVVASFSEAAPGLGISVTPVEKVKIALQILAFALLIAPEALGLGSVTQYDFGRWSLSLSALLACCTTAIYARRMIAQLAAR